MEPDCRIPTCRPHPTEDPVDISRSVIQNSATRKYPYHACIHAEWARRFSCNITSAQMWKTFEEGFSKQQTKCAWMLHLLASSNPSRSEHTEAAQKASMSTITLTMGCVNVHIIVAYDIIATRTSAKILIST